MNTMIFVMAILGCGDGNVACTEARIVPVRYASMAQCRAALPEQLARNTDVPFPMIGADCRRTGMDMASADSESKLG